MNSWTDVLTNIKQAIISGSYKAYAEAVKNALNSNLPERNCGEYSIGYDEGEIRIDYRNNVIFFNEETITICEILNFTLTNDEEIHCCAYLSLPDGIATLYTNGIFIDEQPICEALDSVVKLLNQILEACKD